MAGGGSIKFNHLAMILTLAVTGLTGCKTVDGGSAVRSTTGASATGSAASIDAMYTQSVDDFSHFAEKEGMKPADIRMMYSACWKNPAAKDFTDIQRLVYCFQPLEFRLCNSIVLAKTQLPTSDNFDARVKAYDACIASSHENGIMNKADYKKTYIALFLKNADDVDPALVAKLLSTYEPTLDDAGFEPLLDYMVDYYISTHGGMDSAKKDLSETLTPAVADPKMTAQLAADFVDAAKAGKEIPKELKALF